MMVTYMRGDDEMVQFAPGCFVERKAGERLGILARPAEPTIVELAKGGKRGSKKGGKRGGKCEAEEAPACQPEEAPRQPIVADRQPTETERRTFRLMRKLGNSPREIAAETGWPLGTIKAALADKAA